MRYLSHIVIDFNDLCQFLSDNAETLPETGKNERCLTLLKMFFQFNYC